MIVRTTSGGKGRNILGEERLKGRAVVFFFGPRLGRLLFSRWCLSIGETEVWGIDEFAFVEVLLSHDAIPKRASALIDL